MKKKVVVLNDDDFPEGLEVPPMQYGHLHNIFKDAI